MKRHHALAKLSPWPIAPRACSTSTRACMSISRRISEMNPSLGTTIKTLQISRNASTTSTTTTAPPAPAPAAAAVAPLQKTPLHDFHLAHGAQMVPFAGFHMPLQYAPLSITASHLFTRTHSSFFDVSHMVQHRFAGPGAAAFLERCTPAAVADLAPFHSALTALLLPGTGGIVDDAIVTRLEPDADADADRGGYHLVTNAACRAKDLRYLTEQLAQWQGAPVTWQVWDDRALIALQGPLSAAIISRLLPDATPAFADLHFGRSMRAVLRGPRTGLATPALLTRGGYTGEDGVEISLPAAHAAAVADELLSAGGADVALAGLGARDSLRLEAGMCLYGHDLDESTTPVEASLAWIIGARRREAGGFHGDAVILGQLRPRARGGVGVSRRRVGLVVEGAPAREGARIVDAAGAEVGVVTSGCPSPSLRQNIAMGYVRDGAHRVGTEVEVVVRGKGRRAVVTKMPFVPTRYWKGIAPA